jgi:hypothetical protein
MIFVYIKMLRSRKPGVAPQIVAEGMLQKALEYTSLELLRR